MSRQPYLQSRFKTTKIVFAVILDVSCNPVFKNVSQDFNFQDEKMRDLMLQSDFNTAIVNLISVPRRKFIVKFLAL